MEKLPVYKQHRIHTEQLGSELWIALIVNFGHEKMHTKESLTDSVMRIPGEYESRERAIQAAKQYIDQQETREQKT